LCGNDGRRGYIYHVAVDLEHRNKGIGKALVEKALSGLKKKGINKAALVVFGSNDIGNNFWAAVGFDARTDLIYRDMSININN